MRKAQVKAPVLVSFVFVVLAVFSGCSAEPQASVEPSVSSSQPTDQSAEVDLTWLQQRTVQEPQFALDDRGTLLVEWRQESDDGSDIFVARRGEDGQFGSAVRVNDEAATVESYGHDEMRVALATGPEGLVGVAWTDSRGQVRAAVSSDGAASFENSVRLDQTETAAYRGFPALAFDASGVLNAIWIDSRYAEGMAEEPADLYYATMVDGVVKESNLTAEQEATVCGCCRTHLEVTDDGTTRAVFRNGVDGYRDIYTVAENETGMSAPELVGQPLWELTGCPMSGPITVGDRVLWADGSTGRKVLMVASFGAEPATPLLSDSELGEWKPRLSPRPVISNQLSSPFLLLPGQAASKLIVAAEDDKEWHIEVGDLPRWATSAFYENGSLLLMGSVSGELQIERRPLAL